MGGIFFFITFSSNFSQSLAQDRIEKMPSLAEFGISQSTLAFLNKRGLKDEINCRTQVFKHPILPAKKMDELDAAMTPFDQDYGVFVTPGIGLRMCESPYRMAGMHGLKPHCIQSSRVLVPAGTRKST
jgi:hypothetical protein